VGGDNIGADFEKEMGDGSEKELGCQVVTVTCPDYTDHGMRNSGWGKE
jgi:hypothetical protein